MVLSNENKKLLTNLTSGYKIKDKYYGLKALDKIKNLFFPNNKIEADKWAKRWTSDEKKNLYMLHILLKNAIIHIYMQNL